MPKKDPQETREERYQVELFLFPKGARAKERFSWQCPTLELQHERVSVDGRWAPGEKALIEKILVETQGQARKSAKILGEAFHTQNPDRDFEVDILYKRPILHLRANARQYDTSQITQLLRKAAPGKPTIEFSISFMGHHGPDCVVHEAHLQYQARRGAMAKIHKTSRACEKAGHATDLGYRIEFMETLTRQAVVAKKLLATAGAANQKTKARI